MNLSAYSDGGVLIKIDVYRNGIHIIRYEKEYFIFYLFLFKDHFVRILYLFDNMSKMLM
jgi:hypothetical protein